jgi:carbon-monoxide dehydrogenase iron sulfur subunit
MKRVRPDKETCIGCGLCEIACLTAHSKSKDLVIAHKEEARAGLKSCKVVYRRGHDAVAVSCKHCEEPSCVASCIAGALTKDPQTGHTVYEQEKCVGCWSCVMACPYGAIRRNEAEKTIFKCDLCKDRGSPICVEVCPNRSLRIED